MGLLVAGSRSLSGDWLFHTLDTLVEALGGLELFDYVIHGGARGVDSWAQKWADDVGRVTKVVRPDYDRYGSKAPFVRNQEMVDEASAGIIVWDGYSGGTNHAFEALRRQRKPIAMLTTLPDRELKPHQIGLGI